VNNTVIIATVAVICISLITVVALSLGYDAALISASISTISGIAAAFGAYNMSKAKYPQWHNNRVKKEKEPHEQEKPSQ